MRRSCADESVDGIVSGPVLTICKLLRVHSFWDALFGVCHDHPLKAPHCDWSECCEPTVIYVGHIASLGDGPYVGGLKAGGTG